jgi:hypothetical protein
MLRLRPEMRRAIHRVRPSASRRWIDPSASTATVGPSRGCCGGTRERGTRSDGLISKSTGASPIIPTIVAAMPTPRGGFDVPVRSRSQAVGTVAGYIVATPAAPEIAASVAVAPTDGLDIDLRLQRSACEAREQRRSAGPASACQHKESGERDGARTHGAVSAGNDNDLSTLA